MSKCNDCPHIIGDSTERDCAFPDCVGGWENAFNNLANRCMDMELRLTPSCWTAEMHEAWHKHLPDINKAFEALREYKDHE